MIIITITDFEKGKKDLITLLTEKTVTIASELLVYVNNGHNKLTKMILRNVRMGEDKNISK